MVAHASLHRNNIAPHAQTGNLRAARGQLRMISGSPAPEFAGPAAREFSLFASIHGIADRLARLALAGTLVAIVAACSGAVSGPAPVNDPTRITILPGTATAFSGVPITFVISGGTGSYIVTSSNQAVIPVAGAITGSSITVVPNTVTADTTVQLTVRDSGTTPTATAAVTVKPITINNTVTVTPSASQASSCGTSVCAGGDAEVKVVLALNGAPLANRQVQFDVVSGDFRIITGSVAGVETLAVSGAAVTDATGTARIRVRVLPNATSQTALLRITDVANGAFLQTSFGIAPSAAVALSAQPSTLQFTGTDSNSCSSGVSADVIVSGGRPPYSISSPSAFTVSPQILGSSGDRFTVTSTGQCSSSTNIAVVDSAATSVTVAASNVVGPAQTTPPFVVSPDDVTLTSCNDVASVAIAGGRGSGFYFGASGSNTLLVQTSGNTGTIRRQSGNPTPVTTINVSFSDGRDVAPVTVHLSGTAAGQCF
jgi:hypothetical protein